MKKLTVFAVLFFCALSFKPAHGQDQSAVYPWYWPGAEEYIYHNLAVGGWNVLGPFSPRAAAMGETFFSSLNSTSGYLNPSYLTQLTRPQFSLNYRYSENTYKTSFWNGIVPLAYWSDGWEQIHSFTRKADYLDSAGFVLPFDDLAFAANYFLFQDYNFPDIVRSNYGWPENIEQSGEMNGINFAFAFRLTDSFSLGVSASYVYGDISRFQRYYPYYFVYAETDPGWQWDRPADILPPWPWPYSGNSEKYRLKLKGLFFNIGFTFAPSDKLRVGFMLKPPFSIIVKAEAEFSYDYVVPYDYGIPEQFQQIFSGEFYFKQPLVAVSSVFFKPLESLSLTADLSFWGWRDASTDYLPGWYYPSYDFRNILKLNLGAEYDISLPFDRIKTLSLRAGYIYDPQPYQYSESFARSYFCTGFGLSVWHFEVEAAAKLSLSAKELRRFSSDVLQVGVNYRF